MELKLVKVSPSDFAYDLGEISVADRLAAVFKKGHEMCGIDADNIADKTHSVLIKFGNATIKEVANRCFETGKSLEECLKLEEQMLCKLINVTVAGGICMWLRLGRDRLEPKSKDKKAFDKELLNFKLTNEKSSLDCLRQQISDYFRARLPLSKKYHTQVIIEYFDFCLNENSLADACLNEMFADAKEKELSLRKAVMQKFVEGMLDGLQDSSTIYLMHVGELDLSAFAAKCELT